MNAKELNDIQRQYMQLDVINAPEKEKKRVLDLYKDMPHSFISANNNLSCCTVIHNGSPVVDHVSLEKAINICEANKWLSDVVWTSAGDWIDLGTWRDVRQSDLTKD